MHGFTDARMHGFTDSLMHECTDSLMHECTDSPMHECTDKHAHLTAHAQKFVRAVSTAALSRDGAVARWLCPGCQEYVTVLQKMCPEFTMETYLFNR